MNSAILAVLITLVVLAAAAAGGTWAHSQGHLDPVIEKIRNYLAKAKAGELVADGQEKAKEEASKVLGEENTEAAQEAIGSVGDGLSFDQGDGDLKKRL